MKAVILSGGRGTRLEPLTSTLPKPMVPLFGRPVLEHLLLLLRRHGITQAAMTLGYLPHEITDYFGNGSRWGMQLTYFTEPSPLGTAGGAANCAGSEGGKLLSPQSIAIATAACDMEGQDGDIMRKTMPFAIFWILMNGLMVFLGLHVI